MPSATATAASLTSTARIAQGSREPPPLDPANPKQRSPKEPEAIIGPAIPGSGFSAGFEVQLLLAEAPEAAPPAGAALGAYRSQLAHRMHYAGPLLPTDLTV